MPQRCAPAASILPGVRLLHRPRPLPLPNRLQLHATPQGRADISPKGTDVSSGDSFAQRAQEVVLRVWRRIEQRSAKQDTAIGQQHQQRAQEANARMITTCTSNGEAKAGCAVPTPASCALGADFCDASDMVLRGVAVDHELCTSRNRRQSSSLRVAATPAPVNPVLLSQARIELTLIAVVSQHSAAKCVMMVRMRIEASGESQAAFAKCFKSSTCAVRKPSQFRASKRPSWASVLVLSLICLERWH